MPPPALFGSRAPDRTGRHLEPDLRRTMESRFGHDFSAVRVHTGGGAAESARGVGAFAYTVGADVVFGEGAYEPRTLEGRLLIAHELAHVVQQRGRGPAVASAGSIEPRLEDAATRAATAAVSGASVPQLERPANVPSLQRQAYAQTSPLTVRAPAVEEFVTQLSAGEAGAHGRPLEPAEIALARPIFGSSIDYRRVRLIPGPILEYRTVANTIRVPSDFTIADPYKAQTFIHELTHVWQYQQAGTAYISISLGTQLAASIRSGSRNVAYDYRVSPGASFFDFTPEQQGFIVQNYFTMLRDRAAPATAGPFYSNHFDTQGKWLNLTWAARQAEITRELPLHAPLIAQMQAALPHNESELVVQRATEVMATPAGTAAPVPEERRLAPLRPLVEIRF